MYNVKAKRNGRLVKFNKKPMSYKNAKIFATQLKKATIPSVESKTIKIVKIKNRRKK